MRKNKSKGMEFLWDAKPQCPNDIGDVSNYPEGTVGCVGGLLMMSVVDRAGNKGRTVVHGKHGLSCPLCEATKLKDAADHSKNKMFSGITIKSNQMEEAKRICSMWIDKVVSGEKVKLLFITSCNQPLRGKTELAEAMQYEFMAKGEECIYRSTRMILNALKDEFDAKSGRNNSRAIYDGASRTALNALRTAPVVVLDGLGQEAMAEGFTKYYVDEIEDILRERRCKPTCITSRMRVERVSSMYPFAPYIMNNYREILL